MGKKRREGLVQQSRGERLKVQLTGVSKSLRRRGEVAISRGGKVAFTGWAANVKPFARSLKHFTVAVKGWILFLNPVP